MVFLRMYTKKHLGFTGLRKLLSKRLSHMTDNRDNDKVDYSIHDVFMSAYAMMHFQDSSLLEFQKKVAVCEAYEQSQNHV
jgi:hypothetical protein